MRCGLPGVSKGTLSSGQACVYAFAMASRLQTLTAHTQTSFIVISRLVQLSGLKITTAVFALNLAHPLCIFCRR